MTSYNFQERTQRIREIYDNNDKSIPDVLTVLRLLNINTNPCHLGFYRGAWRQVCYRNFQK